MNSMFQGATNFNQPLSNWNTSKVTSMNNMFQSATNFNQNLSNWDTSKVTTMLGMFYNSSFNQPLNNWDVSKVTNMQQMFQGATSFNQDLGNWNVSSLTTAIHMFNLITLSTINYNSILMKWSKLNLQSNVAINFGSSKYDLGSPLTAKNLIVSNFNWTITDGGQTSSTYGDPIKLRCLE